MTPAEEARMIVLGPDGKGPDQGQATWALRMMVRALTLHPWLNTPEDNRRLAVARAIMRLRRERAS
jgi:hypothetical protein